MSERKATSTPRSLWIVGIVMLLWNAMGALDYTMTQTRNEAYMGQFTPEQLDFFYGFPAWVTALWAIAVWGGLVAAILLLMRKALAVPLFILAFVCMAVVTFQNYVLTNGAEIVGAKAVGFSIVIFVVALGVIIYARAMAKKGVLT